MYSHHTFPLHRLPCLLVGSLPFDADVVDIEDFFLTMGLYSTWSTRTVQRIEELNLDVEKHLRNKRAHDKMAQRGRDEQRRLRLELAEKLAQTDRKLASLREALVRREE